MRNWYMKYKIIGRERMTNRDVRKMINTRYKKELVSSNPKTLFLRNLESLMIHYGMTGEYLKKYREQFVPDIYRMLNEFESDIKNDTNLLKNRYLEDAVIALRNFQKQSLK